jgi:hypothetical protein
VPVNDFLCSGFQAIPKTVKQVLNFPLFREN